MLDQRENPERFPVNEKRLEYSDAVYGSYMNFKPRHHVFEGFANSEEFNGYL